MFFDAVSSKMRVNILEALKHKPMSVNELSETVKEEQSKVSHNLKILSECHLLDMKQEGKKRIYSLNKETMIPLMKLVENHVTKYCCSECRGNDKGDSK